MLPVARSKDGTLQGGARLYIYRRAHRILPPYYAALALSWLAIAFSSARPSYRSVLSHAVLLHNFSLNWCHDINMALWSVATEWQIYFVFPFLLILWRRFGNAVTVMGAFLIGLMPLMAVHYDLSCACFWYVGLFALGMTGADLFTRHHLENNPSTFNRLPLVIAGLSLVYLTVSVLARHFTVDSGHWQFYVSETLRDGFLGGIVLCFILFCSKSAIQVGQTQPLILLILESSIARALGLFSYSLYLTHCIVLRGAYALIGLEGSLHSVHSR